MQKKFITLLLLAALLGGGVAAWRGLQPQGDPAGFTSGNGRVEATEVDVATKLAGRVRDILVDEGAFVEAGQVLAHMQVDTLEAQREEVRAQARQAATQVASMRAQVAVRESDQAAAQAVVAQREAELDAAQARLRRSEALAGEGASSVQELDDDRARVRSLQAALAAAQAQVTAARAAAEATRAQVVGAQSAGEALAATLTRIGTEIDDTTLTAPRAGRVQYRVAQPGEVLGGGGKVLNLVDLSDVFMTFFLPEAVAGRVAIGTEVRIVLDAVPQYVIPARVSFVASTAQFTPKTVETASERQKLMFRVKAQIDRALLRKYLQYVKTGLPGVAWVRLDPRAAWPEALAHPVAP